MCTCTPDQKCGTHLKEERELRLAEANRRAILDNQDVLAILYNGTPNDRDQAKLARAAESLNAYLATLAEEA